MIVPNDVIALFASLAEKMEDDLKLASVAIQEEPDLADLNLVEPILRVSENVDRLRCILRIVVDEQSQPIEREN